MDPGYKYHILYLSHNAESGLDIYLACPLQQDNMTAKQIAAIIAAELSLIPIIKTAQTSSNDAAYQIDYGSISDNDYDTISKQTGISKSDLRNTAAEIDGIYDNRENIESQYNDLTGSISSDDADGFFNNLF